MQKQQAVFQDAKRHLNLELKVILKNGHRTQTAHQSAIFIQDFTHIYDYLRPSETAVYRHKCALSEWGLRLYFESSGCGLVLECEIGDQSSFNDC
jgi:hypothetical protein